MPVPVEYEKDADQKEIYPKVNNVEQVILDRYARDKDQIPFYPRDADNNEYMDVKLGLIQRNGVYVYPKTFADGKPRYRDDPNDQRRGRKRKIYEKIDGHFIIGRGLDGNQYYATDENGDEYYPENYKPAQKANGNIYYARKANGDTIFPKNANNDEFYLTLIDPLISDTIPDRYAVESNGNQIYPQRRVDYNLISHFILNNTYIKCDGEYFYPRDAYNNEFYINPKPATGDIILPADVILDTYALTNDGKVILPGINGTYYIAVTKLPTVNESDILGKLVRERTGISSDYLTKVEVSNKRNIQPKEYKYLDIKTNIYKTVTPPRLATKITLPLFKTWYFWVIVVISLIIKTFVIWWFFLSREKSYAVK